MIRTDHTALICDLAEVYHLFNYREQPIRMVASLAVGLGNNSRIKMKIAKQKITLEQMALFSIIDKLNILIWQQTKDGSKGQRMPQSILQAILNEDKNVKGFDSIEEFEQARKRIIERSK